MVRGRWIRVSLSRALKESSTKIYHIEAFLCVVRKLINDTYVTNCGNAGLGTGERPASETGSTNDGLLVSSKNKHNLVMIYNDFND